MSLFFHTLFNMDQSFLDMQIQIHEFVKIQRAGFSFLVVYGSRRLDRSQILYTFVQSCAGQGCLAGTHTHTHTQQSSPHLLRSLQTLQPNLHFHWLVATPQ